MTISSRPVTRTRTQSARRIVVITIIVFLALSAVIGIISLLGESSSLQGRILGTTSAICAFNLLVLCHLAVVGRTLQIVGFVGIGVSLVALVLGIVMIWNMAGSNYALMRFAGAAWVLGICLAHANLLLMLSGRRNPLVRIVLLVTLFTIVIVALMLCLTLLSSFSIPARGDRFTYWKCFSIAAIVDALGTIVLPVSNKFLRDEPNVLDFDAPQEDHALLTIAFPAEVLAGLIEVSAARQMTVEALVIQAATVQLAEPDPESSVP